MESDEYGTEISLQELRDQLARQLSILLVVVGGFMAWLALPGVFVDLGRFLLLFLLPMLGLAVHRCLTSRPRLGRHLLAWAGTAILLGSMTLYPAEWLPFLGLVPILVGAILVPSSSAYVAGSTALVALALNATESREYPLLALSAALGTGALVAWLVVGKLYKALEWTWTLQQRADMLLRQTRQDRARLGRAFHSLDKTNYILSRTRRELILARQAAEEARLLKERFAANVSHELRTPLNLIMGFTEVMCLSPEAYGDMEWPAMLRRDIHRVYRSSRHLLDMINDVLDLSRAEMVGFTLNLQPTPLEPLIREAVEIVDDLFRDRPVTLESRLKEDLPVLEIDRLRIRQVLLNLLNNAARFTEEGTVCVEAQVTDDEVVISVSDTGRGIPPEKVPHLFEEFYQVDRSLHRQSGAGLGLAVSKHFVDAHDGRIWVESEPGVGSTFTFALPLPDRHVPVSRLVRDWLVPSEEANASVAIVVVDPDPAVADLVQRNLERCEVVHLEDPEALGAHVAAYHPRAVVCNVVPGSNLNPADLGTLSVPVIQCSLPSNAWVADERTAEAYLVKPVTADRLLDAVNRVGNVRTVLVVDDDLGFCQLVERMLGTSSHAFVVRRAYDGAAALEAMRSEPPDLVLLDLIMPEMDGFQVLAEMRQSPELENVPVVLLTATSLAEDAVRQGRGEIRVQRPEGLDPGEVLACLRVLVDVLKPRYDERALA